MALEISSLPSSGVKPRDMSSPSPGTVTPSATSNTNLSLFTQSQSHGESSSRGCIGEMVRKLCMRLDVMGSNPRDRARAFTLRMTCDDACVRASQDFVIFVLVLLGADTK